MEFETNVGEGYVSPPLELEFTPLEFETYNSLTSFDYGGAILEFTPLEFETQSTKS